MAIQTCNRCKKNIEGEFRMELMNGPKGYRRYAVHVNCAVKPAGRMGGRQIAKMKLQKAEGSEQMADENVSTTCSLGGDMRG